MAEDGDDDPSLGNRFKAASADTEPSTPEKPTDVTDTDDSDEPNEAGDQGGSDETDGPSGPHAPYSTSRTYRTPEGFDIKQIDETSVRDGADREFYLPEELLDEIDLAFQALNLRYQREYDRSLNKHPHWYNRLLVIGLATVGDVTERDIDELVGELGLPGADD